MPEPRTGARQLLIGLDGAGLDLVRAFGPRELPHLHACMARGAYAALRSVLPPATLPNWTTLLTGMNPGRHGVFDFTVRDGSASRAHAMIERRREHFVLIDHSSNGTFVTFEGRPEVIVHREELTLVGHGWLAFGQPRAEAAQVAEFRCIERPAGG